MKDFLVTQHPKLRWRDVYLTRFMVLQAKSAAEALRLFPIDKGEYFTKPEAKLLERNRLYRA